MIQKNFESLHQNVLEMYQKDPDSDLSCNYIVDLVRSFRIHRILVVLLNRKGSKNKTKQIDRSFKFGFNQ